MWANITFGCRLRDLTSCVIDDSGGERPLGEGKWLGFDSSPGRVLAGSGDFGGRFVVTVGREAATVTVGRAGLVTVGREAATVTVAGTIVWG